MNVAPLTLLLVWGWATLAGLDLVSLLQTLVSRPLVAGSITGWMLGDVESGLRVGAALELFALDVVPVGSSRYPDFAAATVGAVIYAVGTEWATTLGASVGLGVALAMIGGATLPTTRRLTARVVRAYTGRLAEGDPVAVRAVHLSGLAHDVVRSGLLAALAVAAGWGARGMGWVPLPSLGRALTVVALGGAAWALAHGATASAGTGPRWRWAAVGLFLGTVVAWRS